MSLLRVSLLSSALLIIGHRLPWLAGWLASGKGDRRGGAGHPLFWVAAKATKSGGGGGKLFLLPPLLPPTSIPPLLSLTWQKFPLHLFFLGASLERPPGWRWWWRRRCKSKSSPGGRILPVCEGLSHRPQLFSLSLFSRCFCLHFFVTLASCMRERERERERENLCTNEKGRHPSKPTRAKRQLFLTLSPRHRSEQASACTQLVSFLVQLCLPLPPPLVFFAISRLGSVSAAVALKEEATRNKRSPPLASPSIPGSGGGGGGRQSF